MFRINKSDIGVALNTPKQHFAKMSLPFSFECSNNCQVSLVIVNILDYN